MNNPQRQIFINMEPLLRTMSQVVANSTARGHTWWQECHKAIQNPEARLAPNGPVALGEGGPTAFVPIPQVPAVYFTINPSLLPSLPAQATTNAQDICSVLLAANKLISELPINFPQQAPENHADDDDDDDEDDIDNERVDSGTQVDITNDQMQENATETATIDLDVVRVIEHLVTKLENQETLEAHLAAYQTPIQLMELIAHPGGETANRVLDIINSLPDGVNRLPDDTTVPQTIKVDSSQIHGIKIPPVEVSPDHPSSSSADAGQTPTVTAIPNVSSRHMTGSDSRFNRHVVASITFIRKAVDNTNSSAPVIGNSQPTAPIANNQLAVNGFAAASNANGTIRVSRGQSSSSIAGNGPITKKRVGDDYHDRDFVSKQTYLKERERLREKRGVEKGKTMAASTDEFKAKWEEAMKHTMENDFYKGLFLSKIKKLNLFDPKNSSDGLPQKVSTRMVNAETLFRAERNHKAGGKRVIYPTKFSDLPPAEQEYWLDKQFALHREWIAQAKKGLICPEDKPGPETDDGEPEAKKTKPDSNH